MLSLYCVVIYKALDTILESIITIVQSIVIMILNNKMTFIYHKSCM